MVKEGLTKSVGHHEIVAFVKYLFGMLAQLNGLNKAFSLDALVRENPA